MYISVSNALKT